MKLTKTNLEARLSEGLCIVRYEKKNGEIRTQLGTRDMDLVPDSDLPNGNGGEQSDNIVAFYSLLDEGWRSFRIDSLLGISYPDVSLVSAVEAVSV